MLNQVFSFFSVSVFVSCLLFVLDVCVWFVWLIQISGVWIPGSYLCLCWCVHYRIIMIILFFGKMVNIIWEKSLFRMCLLCCWSWLWFDIWSTHMKKKYHDCIVFSLKIFKFVFDGIGFFFVPQSDNVWNWMILVAQTHTHTHI